MEKGTKKSKETSHPTEDGPFLTWKIRKIIALNLRGKKIKENENQVVEQLSSYILSIVQSGHSSKSSPNPTRFPPFTWKN